MSVRIIIPHSLLSYISRAARSIRSHTHQWGFPQSIRRAVLLALACIHQNSCAPVLPRVLHSLRLRSITITQPLLGRERRYGQEGIHYSRKKEIEKKNFSLDHASVDPLYLLSQARLHGACTTERLSFTSHFLAFFAAYQSHHHTFLS